MYIYHRGVQYDVARNLTNNACEIHLEMEWGEWFMVG